MPPMLQPTPVAESPGLPYKRNTIILYQELYTYRVHKTEIFKFKPILAPGDICTPLPHSYAADNCRGFSEGELGKAARKYAHYLKRHFTDNNVDYVVNVGIEKEFPF